jgi:hypothetical protein
MSEQTSLRPAATLPTILSNADTYNAIGGRHDYDALPLSFSDRGRDHQREEHAAICP